MVCTGNSMACLIKVYSVVVLLYSKVLSTLHALLCSAREIRMELVKRVSECIVCSMKALHFLLSQTKQKHDVNHQVHSLVEYVIINEGTVCSIKTVHFQPNTNLF